MKFIEASLPLLCRLDFSRFVPCVFEVSHVNCVLSRIVLGSSMAQTSSEAFFGIELSGKKKEFVWNGPEETEDDVETKLQILQACLGAGAKEGERNIVDVTTTDVDGKDVTHTIVSMRLGQTEMARMDLGFVDKVTFKLVKGNGPVHFCGLLLHAYAPMSDDEDDEDTSEEEDVPELVKASEKKAIADEKPAKGEKKAPAKKAEVEKPVAPVKAKKGKQEAEIDDESDEDEEMGGKGLVDDEASEGSEEEDDDEEMSDEGDELDSDEDDDLDDEDISEEEEEIEPPKSKKAKVVANGHKDDKAKTPGKKQTPKKVDTPKKQAESKAKPANAGEQKTPKNEKKDGKDAKTPKSAPNVEEVKKKLMKSPNLPKTAEKFKNFMKSAHRVTDDKEVKGIWDWLQKNKK